MTKRWKLKTNSSNILLVLITLILVKAEWVKGENNFPYYTNSIKSGNNDNQSEGINIIVGNDEIADYFFRQSANDNLYIMEGINKCLDNFQLITCVKMLLLSKVNDAMNLMEDPNVPQQDATLLGGILMFKLKNKTIDSVSNDINEDLSLDEEIAAKIKRIFRKRSLLVNLFPKLQIEIEPGPGKGSDFVCFSYTIRNENFIRSDEDDKIEGRKKKKGGQMSMMMIVPPLIMLGLMPFTLASLKAMVMNAVMINMMALNGAIFMTIRNLVFGPRQGDNVKYVNYGYSKDRQTQSKRPVLIIHSPAAFVKQPPVRKKPVHGHYSSQHFEQNHITENVHYPHFHHQTNELESINDYENNYYYTSHVVEQDNQNHRRMQEKSYRKRNDYRPMRGV